MLLIIRVPKFHSFSVPAISVQKTRQRQQPRRPSRWTSRVVAQRVWSSLSSIQQKHQQQQQEQKQSSILSSSTDTAFPDGLWLPSFRDKPIRSIAAPMVAASDYAFRCLCRQYGVDLTFTQMLHAKNLRDDATFRKNHLDLFECYDTTTAPPPRMDELSKTQKEFLRGYEDFSQQQRTTAMPPELDQFRRGPVMVQLAGHDPDVVVQAAQRVLDQYPVVGDGGDSGGGIAGFDLNCGCPQGIARKGNYGAFLMESDQGQTVCRVLSALRRHLPPHLAVSAKIRLPLEDTTTALEERMRRLLETGINFLTIHGRTLKENKTLVRAVHTDRIREAVQIANSIQPSFPIVANGGIEFLPDVERVRKETQTVAIMSSEALLETPHLFQQDVSRLTSRQRREGQFRIAFEYLRWAALYPPLPGVHGGNNDGGGSFTMVRGHLFKFLHTYIQEHPDIRDRLGDMNVNTLVQGYQIVNDLYSRYNNNENEEHCLSLQQQLESYRPNASWYRRHWDANEAATKRASSNSLQGAAVVVTVQERKDVLKERIAQLRIQREARNTTISALPS